MGSSHGKQVLTGKNTAVLKSDQGPNRIGAAARSLERPREKGGVTRRRTKGTCLGTPGRGVWGRGRTSGGRGRESRGGGRPTRAGRTAPGFPDTARAAWEGDWKVPSRHWGPGKGLLRRLDEEGPDVGKGRGRQSKDGLCQAEQMTGKLSPNQGLSPRPLITVYP